MKRRENTAIRTAGFVLLAAILIAIFYARYVDAIPISFPAFKGEQVWRFSVRYRDGKVNPATLPFALKILDIEQPRWLTFRIRSEKKGAENHLLVLLDAKNRNKTRSFSKFEFRDKNGALRWLSLKRRMESSTGESIRDEFYDFTNPLLEYPEDLYPRECLFLVAREMVLKKLKRRGVQVWMNPMLISAIIVRVKRVEKVRVPAGEFESVLLGAQPLARDVFGPVAGKVVQPFVPEYKIWVESKPPYRPLKLEGPLGDIPNTRRLYEVWEFMS